MGPVLILATGFQMSFTGLPWHCSARLSFPSLAPVFPVSQTLLGIDGCIMAAVAVAFLEVAECELQGSVVVASAIDQPVAAYAVEG